MLPRLSDGKIEFPILNRALLGSCAPARVVDTLLRLNDDLVHLIHQILLVRLQPSNNIRVDRAWMKGDERNRRIAACQLSRILDVGELALPVPSPLRARSMVLRRLQGVELDSAREGIHKAKGGEEKDPCVGGGFYSLLNDGNKELDKESVSNVVDCKLIFVALGRESGIRGHNSGVADKDIESRTLREKLLGSLLNRGEG